MADPSDDSLYIVNAQLIDLEGEYGASGEEEDDDEVYIPLAHSPRASRDGPSSSNQPVTLIHEEPENRVEEEGNKRRKTEGREACSSLGIGSAESNQGNEWNRSEIDGLFCPICMDAWTDNGEHHICCLPCGHIYGMSCIKKWLQQRKNSGKCPQCNRKSALRDVRKLFASRVLAADEESQKKIRSLEAKCALLESMTNAHLEWLMRNKERRQIGVVNTNDNCQWRSESKHGFGSKIYGKGPYCNFELQKVFQLNGAQVFDLDASNQILLIAQRSKEIGGTHLLTKMSLLPPYEMEDILLPSTSSAIKDLHISPFNGDLALYASLGRKLSVLSMESNNLVVNYDLQVPAWSCSWDLNSSHYVYAGLQNGSVLVFDMRHTAGPIKSLNGLTRNPVHTVQSLVQDSSIPSGVGSILSASAIGLCQWNIGAEEGPCMIPETSNQGVCISLANRPRIDEIVVSYRPKVDMSIDVPLSQSAFAPSQVNGQGVQGSHVLLKRVGRNHFQKMGSSCVNVSNIRLPKCVIIDVESESRLLASGDEVSCELVLQELPSFRVLQRFTCRDHVRDLKYSPTLNHGLLGCLTEKSLQLFCAKLS
ncbi:E3 ubiquitin-protein ligase RFWD3 isoform X1 [Senna tora]|uniref:RING-type E3 ubiquitin transferase n=1 Tax=Senna tora TaxID=362788 RepID=A0A834TCZ8_9FABA|nr:E3 ubiquitin-protein ligase RFWD3 isoform X1 [Senna tora]